MSFASGMAAIHTLWTSHVGSGDRIVATNALYGGAFALATTIMPRFGVTVDMIDGRDLDAIDRALPGASLFYTETIANPTMAVADLEALGAICRRHGVPAAVDNTFASPALCNPVRFGFDFVLHSSTKYLGGHHDHVGGVIGCSDDGRSALRDLVIDTGGTMAPFEAWLAMRGIMTLGLRMERHCATALRIATEIERHPKVERVHYPGLASHPDHDVAARLLPEGAGGMIAVEVSGGVDGGKAFCDALELAWVATSLGGTHTLVGHAASTTHRQYAPEARRAAGITDGLVRVSVGLEDADDLLDGHRARAGEDLMADRKRRVAVLFGGRSAEHEISCISARSVMDALDPEENEVIPIGITRDGRWHVLPGPPALPSETGRMPEVTDGSGPAAELAEGRWQEPRAGARRRISGADRRRVPGPARAVRRGRRDPGAPRACGCAVRGRGGARIRARVGQGGAEGAVLGGRPSRRSPRRRHGAALA